ncbi:hypothetical protein ACLF3G_23000 [Falsiroseomonas sp. HC035]|uniref:hypothetical protein n=1 Tax=Falsiroseomonas sp. HC035 TaxID=3390999 RepID=UPI003D311841
MADRRRTLRRAADAGRPAAPYSGPERRVAERRRSMPAHGEAGARQALLGLVLAQAVVVAALSFGLWLAALVLHLACCLALPFLLRREEVGAAGWPGLVLRLLAPLLPALGPLAVAGAVAALIGGVPRRLRDVPAPLPEDPLDARLAAIAGARGGSALPAGLLLESLGDVLRWGHARQKAQALELAVQPGRSGGAALLRLALGDPDPQVRARAEALRPQAERRLLEAVEALRGRGRSAAGSRPLQRQTDRELARALDRAAFSGLLEPPRADACRAEAAGLWQALAEPGPEGPDAEAEAALGRNLLALGDLPAARLALESAVAQGSAGFEAIGWLAECLFRARDFAALEALVLRWRPLLEAEALHEGAAPSQSLASAGPHAAAWRLWLAEASA